MNGAVNGKQPLLEYYNPNVLKIGILTNGFTVQPTPQYNNPLSLAPGPGEIINQDRPLT